MEFRDCSIKDIEEKYIEGTPQISAVAVHPDESGEFIEGTNTEDAGCTSFGAGEAGEEKGYFTERV